MKNITRKAVKWRRCPKKGMLVRKQWCIENCDEINFCDAEDFYKPTMVKTRYAPEVRNL